MKGYYGPMADKTGTLWEMEIEDYNSLNHGYNAYAAVMIVKALTGLEYWNPTERKLLVKQRKAMRDFKVTLKTEVGNIEFTSEGENVKVVVPQEYECVYLIEE